MPSQNGKYPPASLTTKPQIFVIPLVEKQLLYAPLHAIAAILDQSSVQQIRSYFSDDSVQLAVGLKHLAEVLAEPAEYTPEPRVGEVIPSALGILSTRACNLACRYCGFLPEAGQSKMPLDMTQRAVNWYMNQVAAHRLDHAEIHFFGGEPFAAAEVIDLAVHLGRKRAAEIGCNLRFEVATNGTFSAERCRWVADNIDTVVLSFDGKPEFHNKHRPRRNKQGSFDSVAQNAKILSEGTATLAIRCCITVESVHHMPEIAAWFCETFRPEAISFEPLQPNGWSQAAELYPPDPWDFARNYILVADIVESYGVELVYATTNVANKQITFCPVAKDFIIVGPDGSLNACYLRRYEWENKGIDLQLGAIGSDGDFIFNANQVAFARNQNVYNKQLCSTCFCRWHCAGGCHVNHELGKHAGDYDRLCIQTRLITLYNVLRTIGQAQHMHELLADDTALKRAVFQTSDLLISEEV